MENHPWDLSSHRFYPRDTITLLDSIIVLNNRIRRETYAYTHTHRERRLSSAKLVGKIS